MHASSRTRVRERWFRTERCDALHQEKNIPSRRLQAEVEKRALNSERRKKLNFGVKRGDRENYWRRKE